MVGSICDLIQHAALIARRIVIAEDDESGTYPAQMRLLARIRLDGTSTVNELARQVGVRPPVVSRMITRFREIGYVEQRSAGRQGAGVVLSKMGRSVRPLTLPARDLDARLTGFMSQQEVAQLARLLAMIVRQHDMARGRSGRKASRNW
jgi:DNA-binding MarR family transcriptional regulator